MTAGAHDDGTRPPARPGSGGAAPQGRARALLEVFGAFLRMGCLAFGGPAAHVGYFHDEFVRRRRWIDDAGFAALLALSQFLPGPSTSQLGFALGMRRYGGLAGGVAAFLGFTLPPATLMTALALGAGALRGPLAAGALHGLKLAAVSVVAHAVLTMARTLAPDRTRAAIALVALAIVTPGGVAAQLMAIGAGLLLGLAFCRNAAAAGGGAATPDRAARRRHGLVALALFAALFAGLPALAALGDSGPAGEALAMANAFYRAGALVFGGGHVVLPLLQTEAAAPAGVAPDVFLTGYALAQAMPGPMFSFAAWLGALWPRPPDGVAGAAVAIAAIFLPGLLLMYGALPFWSRLRGDRLASAAVAGANAAVVGVLAAALYRPLWTSAVFTPADFCVAAAGFLLLAVWRAPPWAAAAAGAASGLGLALLAG
ncbi:chromate efflux transporter [Camelimonas abortus]|uniref:Chromate efflux transporter n=1 Tax=Camelimonas abortus TaxID=1017184 RepID=A0ABV7LF73_9HYPH